jgi:hypothetical protein
MTNFKRQILSVITSGALVLVNGSSVFAATTLEISGNGSSSDNEVKVETQSSTAVVQSNNAVVTNNVSSSASTGGNEANHNTGGDVFVQTGSATTNTAVTNLLNANVANVDCCEENDVEVTISGNGYRSDNEVEIESGRHDATEIFQDNKAVVLNKVEGGASTGGNDAKFNTGGDTVISTGGAASDVEVKTVANANWAVVGGGEETGELSAWISGNGTYSDNEIELELDRDTAIVQDNLAIVTNFVDAYAKTGYNDANYGTGGEVAILTGPAHATVDVDNMVNFNAADIDCGCLLDVTAKISGNGSDSDNEIKAELGGDREVFQGGKEGNGNTALLTNWADAAAKTGWNESEFNTGDPGSDPLIWTGAAHSATEVSNTGNVNVFGGDLEIVWDFAHIMHFLGL